MIFDLISELFEKKFFLLKRVSFRQSVLGWGMLNFYRFTNCYFRNCQICNSRIFNLPLSHQKRSYFLDKIAHSFISWTQMHKLFFISRCFTKRGYIGSIPCHAPHDFQLVYWHGSHIWIIYRDIWFLSLLEICFSINLLNYKSQCQHHNHQNVWLFHLFVPKVFLMVFSQMYHKILNIVEHFVNVQSLNNYT